MVIKIDRWVWIITMVMDKHDLLMTMVTMRFMLQWLQLI